MEERAGGDLRIVQRQPPRANAVLSPWMAFERQEFNLHLMCGLIDTSIECDDVDFREISVDLCP